jgi:hypothetical protein
MDAWEQTSAGIEQRLKTEFSDIQLPIQVMHYLSDADVRVRDEAYCSTQTRFMQEFIAELEQGSVPQSRGITVSLSPWSIVLTVVFVGALLLFVSRSCG